MIWECVKRNILQELVLASKQATTTKPPKHEGVQNHEDVLEGVRRSGVARQELVITSKISPYQIGTDATRTAWQSLADLSPDVLLIHWPGAARLPPSSPLNAQVGSPLVLCTSLPDSSPDVQLASHSARSCQ